MQPVSFVMILLFSFFMLISVCLQAPTIFIGLLLSPILSRSSWYVEFLYPLDIARWAHFFLIRLSSKYSTKSDDKNRGFHSRTVEQKIEVIQDRVYIHPIPQFLDNLGYLIVCLPQRVMSGGHGQTKISLQDSSETIVAIMIDCGEAAATIRAIEMIQQNHYRKKPFQIQAILSTHKHHDHTGGNLGLMKSKLGSCITRVFAGAVERVPYCTDALADGDKVTLPRVASNNMNDVVEIEAVAVPAHTRGSLVYRLSCKEPNRAEFMFTGDTMFSAGAGVPFESDIGSESEAKINRSHGNTFVRAGVGSTATERCFAEILVRGMPNRRTEDRTLAEKILILPGHEYTSELLSRQLATATNEACRWKNFVPRDFFDTVSHLYVALHRRSLPHISGKLLMVPSTLQRELHISPQFRSLRRSGELVIRAIRFWHENFCSAKDEVGESLEELPFDELMPRSRIKHPPEKGESTARRWNVHPEEVSQEVFTTLYTSDLESVIDDLMSERITKHEAGDRLRGITQKLAEPVVNRRAIPGFLPSDKSIYRGIAGFVLLGSRPSAMTWTDSRTMKMPPPLDSSSDRILISKERLLLVLFRLGLLDDQNAVVGRMIGHLWKEMAELVSVEGPRTRYGDVESLPLDEMELGVLKWTIYGVPSNQPSWFSKILCMPCSNVPEIRDFPVHPASKMKQKAGDLVSHDILLCPLCRTSTGCFCENREETNETQPEAVKAIVEIEYLKNENGDGDVLDHGENHAEEKPAIVVSNDTPTRTASPEAGCSTDWEAKQLDALKPIQLEHREAESFNSFADHDTDKAGMAKIASLQSILKEHE